MSALDHTLEPFLIGNDVVDLQAPGARDKADDQRFVGRVFTRQERKYIEQAPYPTQTLWALWAAKESAFKIHQKLNPNLIFAHRKFEVLIADTHLTWSYPEGVVFYEGKLTAVYWQTQPEWIHCYGIYPHQHSHQHPHLQWGVEELENPSIPAADSRQVRILAQRLVERTEKLPQLEIIRMPEERGLGAPRLFSNQKQVEHMDLSLSHDGHYVAAAILCRS